MSTSTRLVALALLISLAVAVVATTSAASDAGAAAAAAAGAAAAADATSGTDDCVEETQVTPMPAVSELAQASFVELFVTPRRAVIINGYEHRVLTTSVPHWRALLPICGASTFTLSFYNKRFPAWAGAERYRYTTLAEFIAENADGNVRTGAEAKGRLLSVLEAPLTELCPRLLDSFVIPRYFGWSMLPLMASTRLATLWPRLSFGGTGVGFALASYPAGLPHFVFVAGGKIRVRVVAPTPDCQLLKYTRDGLFSESYLEDSIPCAKPNAMRSACLTSEGVAEAGAIVYIPGGAAYQITYLAPSTLISMAVADGASMEAVTEAAKTPFAQSAGAEHPYVSEADAAALARSLSEVWERRQAAGIEEGETQDMFWVEYLMRHNEAVKGAASQPAAEAAAADAAAATPAAEAEGVDVDSTLHTEL